MISQKEIENSDDLKCLSEGCTIKKLNSNKKLTEREFRFDFTKNQLVAESKELMKKNKSYSFLKFDEVKRGLTVDDSRLFVEQVICHISSIITRSLRNVSSNNESKIA